MELRPEQLEQLKCVEFDMLKVVSEICDKLNLRYFLVEGTLLGAVRHQGFIPWDDDIDIGMLREDYEVFLKKAPELLPEHLFLQTIDTDKEYMQCFAKIRNSNTAYVEKTVANKKINHGVFIDIFPLDYYPESSADRAKLQKVKYRADLRCGAEYKIPGRTVKQKILFFLVKILFPSYHTLLQKYDREIKKVPKSAFVTNYGSVYGKKEVVPVEWYGDGVKLSFEGLSVTVPAEYDKLLTQIYGDYMTPPPEDKRVGHHYTDVIDLEKSYTEYVGK